MTEGKDKIYEINGTEILNTTTGELISKKEFRDMMGDVLTYRIERYMEMHEELGILPKFGVHQLKKGIFPCVSIKNKHTFNKIFRVKTKEIALMNEITAKGWAFIGMFSNFIEFPTNEVMINNQHPTYEEIGKMLGMGKNTISDVIKLLERYDVVRTVKRNKLPTVIYFNPFLYCAGKIVDVETYRMFEDSVYNPKKCIGENEEVEDEREFKEEL